MSRKVSKKSQYDLKHKTRARWLNAYGRVVVRCRIKSTWGQSTETGIGNGAGFSEDMGKSNRVLAVESAIDDAIMSHIERMYTKGNIAHDDADDLKSTKETYGKYLEYQKDKYDGRGGFNREKAGIKYVKVLSIRVRYVEKGGLSIKTMRRGKNTYTVTRRKGQFIKGGFVKHIPDSFTSVDDAMYGYGWDDDQQLAEELDFDGNFTEDTDDQYN